MSISLHPLTKTELKIDGSLAGSRIAWENLNLQDADFAVRAVEQLLRLAIDERASDVHLVPSPAGLQIAFRQDGLLEPMGSFPPEVSPLIINRIKVLAQLLTYRTDLPQEGRLRLPEFPGELRASTFPTIHGEKVVVRLFIGSGQYRVLDELGYTPRVQLGLEQALLQTSGMLLLTGPAGSGKTTSAYACLRWLQEYRQGQCSLVSLEDPVEAFLPGVSQTQVRRGTEFNYALGLRSLLRQDPDVIFVGEIRDAETAQTAFQASLAGHLVISTFHAGSAGDAICRLTDLGVEPFLLRTGLIAVLCQRLVKRLAKDRETPLSTRRYDGRFVAAELMEPELHHLARPIMRKVNGKRLEELAARHGFVPLREALEEAVRTGKTDWQEVYRILGTRPVDERRDVT